MKMMHLSLILYFIPHIAQASSDATASSSVTQLTSPKTFARIIKLADIAKEKPTQGKFLEANLFLNSRNLIYAGRPMQYSDTSKEWKNLEYICDEKNNFAKIEPNDVLASITIQREEDKEHRDEDESKSIRFNHPTGNIFPRCLPLHWIDGAQTGDLIELRLSPPDMITGILKLTCQNTGKFPLKKCFNM